MEIPAAWLLVSRRKAVMILALSRFKVANGLEDSVARALLSRPRLNAEGPAASRILKERRKAIAAAKGWCA